MALAVTHIILTIVLLDLFRHYLFGKHRFPRYLLVIGGLAGLLPDIDIPLTWLYNLFTGAAVNFHGTFTHFILYPFIFLALALFFHYQKNLKYAKIFYVISAGIFLHLVLDCSFAGNYPFFWPFPTLLFCPQPGLSSYTTSIDAIILVIWLLHEEVHQRIKDYI